MTCIAAAPVVCIAIGCGPDVHVNPAAAGVEKFGDRVEAYEAMRHRDVPHHVSLREACCLSMPIK